MEGACHICNVRPCPQLPPFELTNHFAGAAPLGSEVNDCRALADGQVFERLLNGRAAAGVAHPHCAQQRSSQGAAGTAVR